MRLESENCEQQKIIVESESCQKKTIEIRKWKWPDRTQGDVARLDCWANEGYPRPRWISIHFSWWWWSSWVESIILVQLAFIHWFMIMVMMMSFQVCLARPTRAGGRKHHSSGLECFAGDRKILYPTTRIPTVWKYFCLKILFAKTNYDDK